MPTKRLDADHDSGHRSACEENSTAIEGWSLIISTNCAWKRNSRDRHRLLLSDKHELALSLIQPAQSVKLVLTPNRS